MLEEGVPQLLHLLCGQSGHYQWLPETSGVGDFLFVFCQVIAVRGLNSFHC